MAGLERHSLLRNQAIIWPTRPLVVPSLLIRNQFSLHYPNPYRYRDRVSDSLENDEQRGHNAVASDNQGLPDSDFDPDSDLDSVIYLSFSVLKHFREWLACIPGCGRLDPGRD